MFFDNLADTTVAIGNDHYLIGEYPLEHLLGLRADHGEEVAEIADRIECDGWSPLDIVAGMGR